MEEWIKEQQRRYLDEPRLKGVDGSDETDKKVRPGKGSAGS